MRILLLGPNGQVGWELRRALAPLGTLVALDRAKEDGLSGDLTDPDALPTAIREIRPQAIVNAAAYTAVDRAESEPERAHAINAAAPGILAELAREQGALLVHYSTDYVFDGSGERPWNEDDPPGPLNVYGRTKLAGEQAIRAANPHHLIFRTAWVYAAHGHNFIRTMLRLAAERDALQVIDDQHGAPTSAELIADVTAHAIRAAAGRSEYAGCYHLAAAGETTWHGYARHAIDFARQARWPIRVSSEAIAPVSTEAFPTAARRPHNSRFDCRKLETTFGLQMPDWRDGIGRVVEEMVKEKE